MIDLFNLISKELNINEKSVISTIRLLDEGGTVPFISRYRKEVTGNLDEEKIRNILEKITYYRNLEKRKEEVLKSIEEQGKLTEDLKEKILKAKKLQKVEDLYLPYKRKKKTKADIAIDNGLEPLSIFCLITKGNEKDIEKEAKKYLNDKIITIEEAIEGTKLIIAQSISENDEYRSFIREKVLKFGNIDSVLDKKKAKDDKQVYLNYYDFSEPIKKIVAHRVLALNRGEKEKVLKVSINLNDITKKDIINNILKDFRNENLKSFFNLITTDSLKRLIYPSVEREVRNILTEKAEIESMKVFQENLKNLLMAPPMYEKTILGVDPGYRTGCKLVVVNKLGTYVESAVIYLLSESGIKKSEAIVKDIIKTHDIDIIAIGNGTASRETEKFVADVIKDIKKTIHYIIVNEAGASVYSASKIAKEEFPKLDVTERGAISIARRVQDGLSEFVKIDPKSIGIGMYQHDMNQTRLGEVLGDVVASVVNNVGVNVNSASWPLIAYVSGVKKNIAKNIIDYRDKNGKFKNRKELLKVKGLGAKMYELAAGFIVIPEGDNPIDNTIIHPESYKIAKKMLEEIGFKVDDLKDKREEIAQTLKKLDIKEFSDNFEFGYETSKDIKDALMKERRDPRETFPQPILKSDVLKIQDLQQGMLLEGTIRNVLNFGAFVDIGLKNDALLHISEISNSFIKDPMEVLSVGDIVKIKVKDIDLNRDRVSLTMKSL